MPWAESVLAFQDAIAFGALIYAKYQRPKLSELTKEVVISEHDKDYPFENKAWMGDFVEDWLTEPAKDEPFELIRRVLARLRPKKSTKKTEKTEKSSKNGRKKHDCEAVLDELRPYRGAGATHQTSKLIPNLKSQTSNLKSQTYLLVKYLKTNTQSL